MLAVRLRPHGYAGLCAPDSESGLAIASGAAAGSHHPRYPGAGIDGLTVLRRRRANAAIAGLQCIIVSANIAETALREALSLGAQHYVEKPYDSAHLLPAVTELLEEAQTTNGAAVS